MLPTPNTAPVDANPGERFAEGPDEESKRRSNDADLGPLGLAWRNLRKKPIAMISLTVIAAFLFVAAFASWLPIDSFTEQDREALLAPPSAEHWFGTDHLGRDLFSRTIHAIRSSLWVVAVAVGLATSLGVFTGVIAGFVGGWTDSVIMRFFDSLLAFPTILLAIGVTAVLGPSAFNAGIALAIVGIPRMARIARSGVLSEREREYVEAAESLGVRRRHIMFRHILPNITGSILVQMTLFVAFAILVEAALSFIGLGVQIPRPSLGSMLTDGRPYFRDAWWYAVAPGVTITLLILSVNVLSDQLRDVLDPSGQR